MGIKRFGLERAELKKRVLRWNFVRGKKNNALWDINLDNFVNIEKLKMGL